MKGKLSLEKRKDGFIFIVFSVESTEEVNTLTVDMMETGLDVLYEPKSTDGIYESCFLCAEESGLKIRACLPGQVDSSCALV